VEKILFGKERKPMSSEDLCRYCFKKRAMICPECFSKKICEETDIWQDIIKKIQDTRRIS